MRLRESDNLDPGRKITAKSLLSVTAGAVPKSDLLSRIKLVSLLKSHIKLKVNFHLYDPVSTLAAFHALRKNGQISK